MAEARKGDVVRIHYTGKLDDGSVFDSSGNGDPIEVPLGDRAVIEGLEEAVIGMKPGESKVARVPPKKAFGERREERLVQVDRGTLPDWLTPEKGQLLKTKEPGGGRVYRIAGVEEDRVTIDANHPLAGREIILELELVEIA